MIDEAFCSGSLVPHRPSADRPGGGIDIVLRGIDRADRSIGRPGKRECEGALPNPHYVINAEKAARFQNASRLAHQSSFVGYVHPDMEHHGPVEGAVCERHLEGAAMMQKHPVLKAAGVR